AVALGALAGADGSFWVRAALATVLIAVGVTLWVWGLGFDREEWRALFAALRSPARDEDEVEEASPAAAPAAASTPRRPATVSEPPQNRVVERPVAPAVSKRSQRERQS